MLSLGIGAKDTVLVSVTAQGLGHPVEASPREGKIDKKLALSQTPQQKPRLAPVRETFTQRGETVCTKIAHNLHVGAA